MPRGGSAATCPGTALPPAGPLPASGGSPPTGAAGLHRPRLLTLGLPLALGAPR